VTALLAGLRLQARSFAKAPSFTVTVLLTLGVGIGATVAVFSVVNSVLLKPLPYPQAEELVAVWHVAPGAPGITDASGGFRSSPSMYYKYSEESTVFESIGLWTTGAATVTGLAAPEEVGTVAATPGLLETLRVPPLHGRWLAGDDFVPNGPSRAMLSHDYWQTRFGGDPGAVGRNVTVNGVPAEIVGVMPPGFRVLDAAPGLILPMRFDRAQAIAQGAPFCCRGIARLKTGTTIEQANTDAERVLDLWYESVQGGRQFYQPVWQIAPALRPLKQDVVGSVGSVLWVVFGTVGVVLLIACANVTNLLLVRAEARERELAVRAALGAGSWRIARGLLLETVSLAALGGALGLAIAYGALGLLRGFGPATLPRVHEIALDWQGVALTAGVSLLAGLMLGAIPALKVAGPRVAAALRSGARGASGGRRQHRAQGALVVAQVALALVLLVSSGLMIRTFQALLVVDPGFANAGELQTVRLAIPAAVEPDPVRVVRMQNDIVDALEAIPGVSAAFLTAMPLEGRDADWDVIDVQGGQSFLSADEAPIRRFHYMSPGMPRTAGTRLVAGRDIEWNDVYDDRPVAMVSENLARELWGSPEAALGKRIAPARATPDGRIWREIVGVVQNVRDNGLSEPAPTIVYWPAFMRGFYAFENLTVRRTMTFIVRTPLAGTPGLVAQMQQAVWSVNRDLPLASVRTMQEIYDASLARPSFTLVMLAAAAAVALVLGVVGLYGVLAYVIAQRRREIAIRLALGAQPGEVTRRFVRYGLALACVGVGLGLVAAVGVTRLMESLLFGVQPIDVPTYAAVVGMLAAVAAFASWLPARRASAVDPAEALAAE
jgi:predicted permease